MKRKRLLWQLFPTYLLLVLLVSLAATWYDARSLRDFFVHHTADDLLVQARLVEQGAASRLSSADPASADALCKFLGKQSGTRFTVILPNGRVVGDSEENPGLMDNHATREEVKEARTGITGVSTRYSHTLKQDMTYVAIPLYDNHHQLIGFVRTSLPVLSIGRVLQRVDFQLFFGGLIIALLAAVISLLVSRKISRPLEEIRLGAQRFARGELKQKLEVPDSEEIGSLAEAMNDMAMQLDERISTILRHRNEQEAILSSMIEGVFAVDMKECLISMNNAAAQMLQVNKNEGIGRSVQEVIRNADLQQFVTRTLEGTQPVEGDIVLRNGGERSLQANGAILRDAQQCEIGAVIVLNDVTRLRRLENVRREFVANVSHELRTPITSIKGFVETLLDGALDDRDDAEHFLNVIAKQVDRLNVIIEDLLTLSTLEQGTERSEIGLVRGKIGDVLATAVQVCIMKANAKHIQISTSCPDDLSADINPPLLEQAIVNLIDNAIKYSDEGSSISVEAESTVEGTKISVRDTGCGIGREHLPRLFERFYRVDKARSRKLGGTGLGLAIVKHIAQAHGGHVAVASTLGKGSLFSIHLPS